MSGSTSEAMPDPSAGALLRDLRPSTVMSPGFAWARLTSRKVERSGKGAHDRTYRRDIDGLRAVAVLPVVLYHAGVAAFGGGYVGVDIFFVISGYLIMSTLSADIAAGQFSVAAFYVRRTRRIFPALFAMAFSCLAVGLAILPAGLLVGFGKNLLAMSLFVSNFYFRGIAVGSGYFDGSSEGQILLHTWSLSVEEQFYILLPLALVLLRRQSPRVTRLVLLVAAAASFALAVATVGSKPNYAFYIVFPRAWELLAGSLLATGILPRLRSSSMREAAALCGLALIVVAVFAFSKATTFPGVTALLPCLGAVLIIYAGEGGPTLVGRVLSLRPLVLVGLISYSLYLWHWPVIVFTQFATSHSPNLAQLWFALALSFGLAVLSYQFIEKPFRSGRLKASRTVTLTAGCVVIAAAVVASLAVLVSGGLPQRFSPPAQRALAANLQRKAELPDVACLNWQKDVRSVADISLCPIGRGSTGHHVLLWGDSHLVQMRPLIARLAREQAFGDRDVISSTAGGCLPTPHLNRTDGPYHCDAFSRLSLQLMRDSKVDAVLIGYSGWFEGMPGLVCQVDEGGRCRRRLGTGEIASALADELREVGKELASRHVPLIVMLPAPDYNLQIPDLQINRIALGAAAGLLEASTLANPLIRSDLAETRRVLAAAAADVHATVFDARRALCDAGRCRYQRDGVSLYADATHVATSQVGLFHDDLRDALRSALGGGTVASIEPSAD